MLPCRLLLDQPSPWVSATAHSYLLHFLSLHLARDSRHRPHWINLVLSAFRNVRDEKVFRTFDYRNPHDLHSCGLLWADLFSRLKDGLEKEEEMKVKFEEEEMKFKLEGEEVVKSEVEDETEKGPWLLLSFLTTLLQRDLENWWKHGRLVINLFGFHNIFFPKFASHSLCRGGEGCLLPVLYYLLGEGGRGTVLTAARKTVVRLYR